MNPIRTSLIIAAALLAGSSAVARAAGPTPLPRAHAHNDYEHTRPLVEALENGFCNVEADVWLVEGRLLVAHDLKNVKPERTLASLYLDPLRERVLRNGGRVFAGGPPVVLLIDVKSDAAATYAALHDVLKGYADILTSFRGASVEAKAITVVVSGNRAVAEMAAQPLRFAAVDGRSGDLETNPPAQLVPWVSENWQKLFAWRWQGAMPEKDRTALHQFVTKAHAQKRQVRFWNTPDQPEAWKILLDAGVDIIGTDDLAGLSKFLAPR
ncbi:MAG: hypothetical protein EXS37_18825 [Opitutus sp.]|nr:hypothetical protein [Opitutus sp.]